MNLFLVLDVAWMGFLALFLDHKEISDQGYFIKVNRCKVGCDEASEEKSSTDSADINDQVGQHVDWVLDDINLSA